LKNAKDRPYKKSAQGRSLGILGKGSDSTLPGRRVQRLSETGRTSPKEKRQSSNRPWAGATKGKFRGSGLLASRRGGSLREEVEAFVGLDKKKGSVFPSEGNLRGKKAVLSLLRTLKRGQRQRLPRVELGKLAG